MTRRVSVPYADREVKAVFVEGAMPIMEPVAGFYRMKLSGGGVAVGIKLWNGPPYDPIDGTELDRSWRWQAHVNGKPIDFDRVWPKCVGQPIDAAEYEYLSSLQAWGEANAPNSPEANPHKSINWLTAPLNI